MVIDPLAITIEPLQLFRVIAKLPGAFFLDTAQPGGDNQFSFMGFQPRMQLRISADSGLWLDGRRVSTLPSPLDFVDLLLEQQRTVPVAREIPFAGGVVLAISYEAKNWVESLPDPPGEQPTTPRLAAAVYDSVIAYSHRSRSYVLASWKLSPAALRDQARMIESLARSAGEPRDQAGGEADPGTEVKVNMSREQYLAKVRRVREYISMGDVYQVNLCQRFRTGRPRDSAKFYTRLRQVQPVPYGFYLDLGDFQIAGNSPERFLRRRGEQLATCPIKGTWSRRAGIDDASAIAQLKGSRKDAAEHVMIVDVERNDLGRVCRTGTVHVEALARPISLSTLYHLESMVAGKLPAGISVADILRATFPSGSITGAPKIRAMEIIAELEPEPRGFYTGAVGYLDQSGDFELAMAIRTAIVDQQSVTYSAGGGIVADSIPELEFEECLLKAKAFFSSLGCRPSGNQLDAPELVISRLP